MPVYRITTETEGREVYELQADTEEEARERVDTGAVEPIVSEVIGGSIERVEEVTDR